MPPITLMFYAFTSAALFSKYIKSRNVIKRDLRTLFHYVTGVMILLSFFQTLMATFCGEKNLFFNFRTLIILFYGTYLYLYTILRADLYKRTTGKHVSPLPFFYEFTIQVKETVKILDRSVVNIVVGFMGMWIIRHIEIVY